MPLESAARKAACSSAGNVEVLIDLSPLSKLQFQHLLLRSITDAGNTAGVYRNSLHTVLDADEPTKYQMR